MKKINSLIQFVKRQSISYKSPPLKVERSKKVKEPQLKSILDILFTLAVLNLESSKEFKDLQFVNI